jgi:hypothetical protein
LIEPLEKRTLMSVVFAPASSISLGTQSKPFAVITADVNNDGIPDIITANKNGSIDIMLGNGNGTFQAPENFVDGLGSGGNDAYGPNIAVVDINGDSDIIVANGTSSTISILQENSPGTFSYALQSVTRGTAAHIVSLATATFNGTAFLVTGDNDGSVSVLNFNPQYYDSSNHRTYGGFEGFGSATIQTAAVVYNSGRTTASFITSVAAADFNGDGTTDLVVVGTNNLHSNGHAVLVPFLYSPYNSTTYAAAYTKIDFAETKSLDNVAGDYAFSATPVRFSPTNSYSTYSDLLVTETNGDVIPLTGGEGTSVFAADPTVTGLTDSEGYVAVGDFNGDGKQDFLLSSYYFHNGKADRESQIFLGNGSGGFTPSGPVMTHASYPYAITAGQLAGDGLSDIVTTYYRSPTTSVSVALNQTPLKPRFTDYNASATFDSGQAYSYSITTVGFPDAKLTLMSTLPPGLQFKDNGNDTGVLSGTATGPGGNFTLDFKATNSSGTATQALIVSVVHPPIFTSPPDATFVLNGKGKSETFTIKTAGGFPEPTLTLLTGTSVASLSSTTSPATSLTFTANNNGTATISGIPIITDGGVYDAATGRLIEIQAVSGDFTATQIFTLTVETPPTFQNGTMSFVTTATGANVTVGSPMTPILIDATGGGVTFPIATLGQNKGRLPAGVTFQNFHDGMGQIVGTPAPNTAGTYTVIFVASNPNGKAEDTVTLVVSDDTLPKFNNAGSTVFVVGKTDTFSFSTTLPSHDTDATLEEQGALPAGVTFKAGPHGTAILTGRAAAETGGVYDITIGAAAGQNDSDEFNTQSFVLTVEEPPSITSGSNATFDVGTAGTFTFTTDVSNFPPPTLSLSGLPADLLSKRVAILGSTGSIGVSSLEVIQHLGPPYRAAGLERASAP